MNPCSCPNCHGTQRPGCWYKTGAWRRTREAVLIRDMRRCYVSNCPLDGNVADHIDPVHPTMTRHDFFAMSNLRASCKRHNTARGVKARLERETAEGVEPAPSANPLVVSGSIFARRRRSPARSFR